MAGNDAFVDFLLQSNTTNGSTTFVDSATPPKTITQPAAAVTHTNAMTLYGSTTTINLPGLTNGYLQIPNDADFDCGTGDFSLDLMVYFTVTSGTSVIIEAPGVWRLWRDNLSIKFTDYTNSVTLSGGNASISGSTWAHVALSRTGNAIKLFVNGRAGAESATYTYSLPVSGNSYIHIGAASDNTLWSTAKFAEIRWSKGYNRFPLDFCPWPYLFNTSPPTISQGGNDGYTRLLIQSDTVHGCYTILDTSPTKPTFTPYGYTSLFHSTALTRLGTKTTIAMSSGTSMQISYSPYWNLGTRDFTIDFHVYSSSYASQVFLARGLYFADGWYIRASSGYAKFQDYAAGITLTAASILSAGWHHIAVTRSGNTFYLFVDGVQAATGTSSASMSSNNYGIHVGAMEDGSASFAGFWTNIRISVHVARWTTGFTVPTLPYDTYGPKSIVAEGGAIVGGSAQILPGPGVGIDAKTTVLIKSETTNGSVIFTDRAPVPAVVTAVATTHSTDFAKFGLSSIKFLAGNNRLSVPAGTSHDFSTNDFTIDLWFRTDYATLDYQLLAWQGYWMLRLHNYGSIEFQDTSGSGVYLIAPSGSYTAGQWYHVAIVRYGTRISMYVNGVLKSRIIDADSIIRHTSYGLFFGATSTGAARFYGYMEEIRVSKIARWLHDSFVPPTEPYSNAVTYRGAGGAIVGGTGIRLTVFYKGVGGVIVGGTAPAFKRFFAIAGGIQMKGDVGASVDGVVEISGGFPRMYGDIDTGWSLDGGFPKIYGDAETIHTINVAMDGGFPKMFGESLLAVTFSVDVAGGFPRIHGGVELEVAAVIELSGGFPAMFGDCQVHSRIYSIDGGFPRMYGDCSAFSIPLAAADWLEYEIETGRGAGGGPAGPAVGEAVVFLQELRNG